MRTVIQVGRRHVQLRKRLSVFGLRRWSFECLVEPGVSNRNQMESEGRSPDGMRYATLRWRKINSAQ